jgi:methylated-DNA-protein-cysteine methyltransferase related protein
MPKNDAAGVYQAIYNVIQQIPKGSVATYGQIARLAGIPGQPRRVGYALGISENKRLPWHRVVNARGEISRRWELDSLELQRVLLMKEGIIFDKNARISLKHFQWQPNRKV